MRVRAAVVRLRLVAPGGFGERGVEGKVEAIRFARERGIPFLGICLGMQCAAIEFARNVVGLEDAHSSEFSKDTSHPVICLMDEQRNVVQKGGTMRLGAQPTVLEPGSRSRDCYRAVEITERHRHRYEFNNVYRQQFAAHGMSFAGLSPTANWSRFSNCPSTPGSSRCSSIRNSNRSRPLRTRSSPASSGRRSSGGKIAAAAARTRGLQQRTSRRTGRCAKSISVARGIRSY